jgi:beta-lactamase superfamily II metal-dependent hydrolase
MYPNLRQRLGVLLGVCIIGLAAWITPLLSSGSAVQPYLTVTFLNIGQGDSILIETPDGVQALIDGGPDTKVLSELAASLPWFDRTLDMVVGTHPDKDHIGGLVDVLKQYKVSTILTTENTGETMTSANFRKALTQEGAQVLMARAGQVYQLGASTTLTIFSPASDPSMLESNTASIVAQVQYGDTQFMLTGDAPSSVERYLAATYGSRLESEVLKLGHHGSKNSSSDEFLTAVNPKYAVVSAGKNNTYGHPSPEAVVRVKNHNIPIVSTIDEGRITFASDGKTVWEMK